MAVDAGSAFIKIIPDMKSFTAETQAGVQATGSKLKGVLGTLGTTAGLALAAGVAVGFKSVIDAASAQNEALNKSTVIFGQAQKAVTEFADTSAEAFGISKTAALEAAGGFGNILKVSGLTEQAAADMSVQLVALAGDLASFNNIGTDEALEKIRAGLVGEAEPLRTVGVLLSEARVQQEAYASGIAAVGSELTDAQKVQARFNIILKDTADAQGDAAATADTLAGRQRQLSAQFQDFQAELGTALLPVVTELLEVFQNLLQTLEPVLTLVGQLGPVFEVLGHVLTFLLSPLLKVISLLQKIPFLHQEIGISSLKFVGDQEQVKRALRAFGTSAVETFDKLSKGEREWAQATKEAATISLSSIGNVKRGFELTAKEVVRSTGIIADKQRVIAGDLRKLDDINIGEGLKKRIAALGPDLVHAFVTGNKNQREKIIENLRDYDDAVKDTNRRTKALALTGGQNTGQAFATGLAGGIKNGVPAIEAAARAAALAAEQAARDALESESPSKVMWRVGKDIVEGLALGIENNADKVVKGMERMLDDAKSALQRAISNMKSFMAGVRGGIGGIFNIGQLFGQTDENGNPIPVGDLIRKQVADAQALAAALKAAAKAGLGKDLIAQFASQGAAAIPQLQELLANPELLAQLQQASTDIGQVAGTTADSLGQRFFGAAIDRLHDRVDRLSDVLERLIDVIAGRDDVILVQVDGQTIFRAVRDQALRAERNNGRTGL